MINLSNYITEKLHLKKGINSGKEISEFSNKVFALLRDCGLKDYINKHSEFTETIDTYLYNIRKKYHELRLIASLSKKDAHKVSDDVHNMFEAHLFEVGFNRKNIIEAFTEEPQSKEVYYEDGISVRYRADDDNWYGIMISSDTTITEPIIEPIIFYDAILS